MSGERVSNPYKFSGQTRRQSAIEACANVAIGYAIAVATQAAVFPLFDLHASPADHVGIAGIFTAVSLARSYAVRRAFNAWGRE